jgi:hypothetical protein
MKNLYKYTIYKSSYFLLLFLLLNYEKSFSQETVIWNNAAINNVAITGQALISGVDVTATTSGVNGNYNFQIANNSTIFQGRGPFPLATTVAADDLLFTFSQPVIVTNFFLTEVNTSGAGGPGSWNDSFTLFNAGFSDSVPNNVTVSPTGVQLVQGINLINQQASFQCSNPVQNFELHFALINSNTTTAWLNYTIDLIAIPIVDPICLNSSFDLNGIVIGNNVQGTWNPDSVDTNIAGDFVYIFTPNAGQPITCNVPVTITVLPANDPSCCQSQITLFSPNHDMSNATLQVSLIHREASDWITASNVIGIGNSAFQNGVVYHAANYVDLVAGFDAVNDSQFAAYIEGCSNDYVYKNLNASSNNSSKNDEKINLIQKSTGFSIIPNPSVSLIEILGNNIEFSKVEIIFIDGRKVFETSIENSDKVQVDISNYKKGIYIVNVIDSTGQQFSQKLMKN